jgi:hypothetical protein
MNFASDLIEYRRIRWALSHVIHKAEHHGRFIFRWSTPEEGGLV